MWIYPWRLWKCCHVEEMAHRHESWGQKVATLMLLSPGSLCWFDGYGVNDCSIGRVNYWWWTLCLPCPQVLHEQQSDWSALLATAGWDLSILIFNKLFLCLPFLLCPFLRHTDLAGRFQKFCVGSGAVTVLWCTVPLKKNRYIIGSLCPCNVRSQWGCWGGWQGLVGTEGPCWVCFCLTKIGLLNGKRWVKIHVKSLATGLCCRQQDGANYVWKCKKN